MKVPIGYRLSPSRDSSIGLNYIQVSFGQWNLMEISKQPSLLSTLKVTLDKLIAQPHVEELYWNAGTLGRLGVTALVCLVQKSTFLCKLRKVKDEYQPSHSTFDLQCCPACKICSSNGNTRLVGVASQCLTWFKATPENGTHTQHCFGDKKKKTKQRLDIPQT